VRILVADHERLGVANLVSAHGLPFDCDHGQRGRRTVAQRLNGCVGSVDAVEDGRAQEHGFRHRLLQRISEALRGG